MNDRYETLDAYIESETENTVTIIVESKNGKRTKLVMPK